MQHRRSAVPGLDDCAGRIPGSGTCAGERNAKLSRNARIRIGHIHHGAFVPARDDTKSAVPLDGIVERNVMNADNSKYCIDADSLQFLQ